MKILKIAFILFFTASFAQLNAQDKIVKTNGDTLTGEVQEILEQYVIYKLEGRSLQLKEKKADINKLIFANGDEMVITPMRHEETTQVSTEGQATSTIKLEMIKPLFDVLELGYEHVFRPGVNGDLSLGYIGANITDNEINYNRHNLRGFYLKTGVKFVKLKWTSYNNFYGQHVLNGTYFKPEISFTTYAYERNETVFNDFGEPQEKVTKVHNSAGALIFNFGVQKVINEYLLFDVYVGAGYSAGADDQDRHYSHIGDNFAYNGGIKLGVLLK